MAKFKVKNPKCSPKDQLKTKIQFYHNGKCVVCGEVITIDLSDQGGMANAADLVLRGLAEPADTEAETNSFNVATIQPEAETNSVNAGTIQPEAETNSVNAGTIQPKTQKKKFFGLGRAIK